jgi:hypothetical protein
MTSRPSVKAAIAHRQRVDRRRLEVEVVLAAMRGGAALHCHYQNGRQLWWLSSGPFVSADVAAKTDLVAPVGDALFADVPSQTWRWCGGAL